MSDYDCSRTFFMLHNVSIFRRLISEERTFEAFRVGLLWVFNDETELEDVFES